MEDQRERFNEIVAHLTSEDPGLRRLARDAPKPLSTATRTALLVAGGVVWGLLSVAMVAWGAAGVVLTVLVVAATAATLAWLRHRRRSWAGRPGRRD